ncbi:Octopine transport system permease protein OccQ [Pseudovibrio axinellae]|uniref:Octopine transport system permease protein OccQ n=1 Tax=Pseudovibrio axinellae TaxID=989403 RepID=A0A165XS47_9HYPH|nr:ABC transporter permease subunit [Pseudovibrio axinellae]KZL17987.1 Octopine transport system permease protein OccQ [Pseudovibrio axinellae]SER14370.1 amino acid ABC transporter membrane protein 1, PAAT family [Pseudovibrio axinellae]
MDHSIWTLLSFGDAGWGDEFASGFWLTIKVSIASYCVSVAIGLVAAVAKLSKSKTARAVAEVYTTVVRAIPELLLILLLYYAVATSASNLLISIGLASKGFQISPFIAAVSALGFVSGAFMTEVFRAAFNAISKGQAEAANALGLSPLQTLRLVTLPQMVKRAIPGMANLWLSITKETALISVLGSFHELLYVGYRAAANTKHYSFFYGFTAALFLLITLISVLIIRKVEGNLSKGYSK